MVVDCISTMSGAHLHCTCCDRAEACPVALNSFAIGLPTSKEEMEHKALLTCYVVPTNMKFGYHEPPTVCVNSKTNRHWEV